MNELVRDHFLEFLKILVPSELLPSPLLHLKNGMEY